MIKEKEIKVKINTKTVNYYKQKGYDCSVGETIFIKTKDLSKGCRSEITAICKCGIEKKIKYQYYYKNVSNGGYYSCIKCKNEKYSKTCNEKYGVDNISKLEETKNKIIKKNIENWGFENKYDSPKYRNYLENLMIEKYGYDYAFKNKSILDKCKNTIEKKYGQENPFKCKLFQEKVKETKKNRWNDEYYTNREKAKQTMIKLYGNDNPSNIEIFKQKREETLKNNGYRVNKDEYTLYKNKVRNLTKKNKKYLLENWNGYDFYDGEYIKDNFQLHFNDKKYPTVDHKISIIHGFKNSINPEIISSIENLCMTKRTINSKKNYNFIYNKKQ